MSYLSLPTKYQTAEYSDNLIKVFIRVMHDKENHNGSSFSLEAIDKAKESLKNIPILAYIKENEDGSKDFDEHNVEISVDFDGEEITLKEKFLETPIGVIPESTTVTMENIDGYNYLCCEGYIWKNYSNEAFDILSEAVEKKVSMEIKVNEGSLKDDYFHITNYQYLGVTVLGEDCPPAMGDKCIISMNFSTDNVEFYKAIEDLNKELKKQLQEGEVLDMENMETKTTEIVEEVTVQEETPVVEETPIVEEVTEDVIETDEDFAQKKKKKGDSSSDATSKCNETEEVPATPETEEVVDTKVDLEPQKSIKEELPIEEPKTEETVVEDITTEEVVEAPESNTFTINNEGYEALISELEELRLFKSKILKQERISEIDSIVSNFGFEEEEISELRTKAINEEITLEQFNKELFAIEGMKAFSKRKKFNTEKQTEPTKIVVTNTLGSNEGEPYDGLFVKYKK